MNASRVGSWQALWRSTLAILGGVAYVGVTGVLGGYLTYFFIQRYYVIGSVLLVVEAAVLSSLHLYSAWKTRTSRKPPGS